MDPISPENQIFDRKKLIEELTHGHELVKELKVILDNPSGEDNFLVANDLTSKILSSFMGSISLVNWNPKDEFPMSASLGLPDLYSEKELSGDSSKTSVLKDQKVCCRRRKKSHTSIQIIPHLIDDGHAWRKYGQKHIQSSKQPRNYFRCTHRFDQGCQATKQVQKTEHEPPMYRIAYHEKHTCKNPFLKTPQLFFETNHLNDSQFLISFDSSNKSHDGPTFTNFPYIKQECNPIMDENKSQNSDHNILPDLTTYGSSGPMSVFSSGSISDFSATSNPNCGFYNMDMMEGFHGFQDNLEFEFGNFYPWPHFNPIGFP